MASTIFENAELSMAAYATLNMLPLEEQTTALKNAGMVGAQADMFAPRYRIVTQVSDAALTSFSAIVFKNVAGSLTLAIRGTLELTGTPTNLSTDADIFTSGAGSDPIVAMANWWRKVFAAEEAIRQYACDQMPANGRPNGYL